MFQQSLHHNGAAVRSTPLRFGLFGAFSLWFLLGLYGCGGNGSTVVVPVRAVGPNRLVFTAIDPPKTGIYTVNPDGSALIQVISDQVSNTRFNPDGSEIAFDAGSGVSSVHVISLQGKSTLDRGGGDTHAPAFSPDGTKIVFVESSVIKVMNADGSGAHPISASSHSTLGAEYPVYAPNGRQILFIQSKSTAKQTDPVTYTTTSHIALMNVDGSNIHTLTTTGTQLDANFSPDGKRIVYTSDDHVWVMSADGSQPRQLTTVTGTDHNPVFSPDGTKIAFASTRDVPNSGNRIGDIYSDSRLYIMNADGTAQTRIEMAGGPYTGIYGLDWR